MPLFAEELVGSYVAVHDVVAVTAVECIVAGAQEDRVGARAPDSPQSLVLATEDGVVALTAVEQVGSGVAVDPIVAGSAVDGVGVVGANTIRDGVSLTPKRKLRALALASEITAIGNLEGYLKFSGPWPAATVRLNYVARPKVAARFAPLLQRSGACTAFITTSGFRDVLEVGYESRYDQYDLMIEMVAPIVPRRLRFPVPERVNSAGRIIEPLREEAVRAVVPQLVEAGIESVAVGFLNGYANPQHERRVEEILAGLMPGLSVTLASEVCPEVREYERFTTASVNAYIRPLMEGYLARLEELVAGLGLRCPILLMTLGGGLATIETARRSACRWHATSPPGPGWRR